MTIQRILVLCVGNICRSPLAEALLAQKMPKQTVFSAGLSALVGHAADSTSISIAQENNLDISNHRAQQVTAPMCQSSDLILVMEQEHKAWLSQKYSSVRGKVFTLGHFSQFDIPDPYKKSKSHFENAWELIQLGVDDWVANISKLS